MAPGGDMYVELLAWGMAPGGDTYVELLAQGMAPGGETGVLGVSPQDRSYPAFSPRVVMGA